MTADSLIILLLLILIFMILLLYKQQLGLQKKQQGLEKTVVQESLQLFNQLESYQFIRDRLNLRQGLPYTRDWSASPDFLKLISEHCLQHRPTCIVECSSGLSSLVLARCCQLNQHGSLFSLENGDTYAQASREHLDRYKLNEYAQIIHAPLKNFSLNNKNYQWYDIHQLADDSIDMLVIDGPPGFLQKNSRYPALPLLYKKLSSNCVIFMDDAARADEQEIVRLWLKEFNDLQHEYISLMRGCSILKKQST